MKRHALLIAAAAGLAGSIAVVTPAAANASLQARCEQAVQVAWQYRNSPRDFNAIYRNMYQARCFHILPRSSYAWMVRLYNSRNYRTRGYGYDRTIVPRRRQLGRVDRGRGATATPYARYRGHCISLRNAAANYYRQFLQYRRLGYGPMGSALSKYHAMKHQFFNVYTNCQRLLHRRYWGFMTTL